MKKWVLLEHKVNLGESLDIHFDFLLENGEDCLTWKILEIPSIQGGLFPIIEQPNHRLVWLSRLKHKMSYNRGYVKRIDHGFLKNNDINFNFGVVSLILKGKLLKGVFKIEGDYCQLISNN